MEEVRNTKGITLVALIITIIILLTLSVVTIRTVTGDGIIAHAKNAKNQYEQKAAEENALLSNLTGYITGQVGGSRPSGPALSEIKIGDKVAYDEGYRADKKSDIDTNFQMDDMEWRVLDVEANGTVKLISTKPTTSTFTLSGEDGWLNGPTKLDKLCSDLYANGTGVTARSLKIEDVDKLANMLTSEARKIATSNYGTKWKYQYNATESKIQYSKQNEDGIWISYTNTGFSIFKEPGKDAINSSNYQNSEEQPIEVELEYTSYSYSVSSKIASTVKTSDNILVSELITKGLNDTNNAVNNSNVAQWLSSCCVTCSSNGANFQGRYVNSDGNIAGTILCISIGGPKSPVYVVRPVIELSANNFGTEKVNGVWQVNI